MARACPGRGRASAAGLLTVCLGMERSNRKGVCSLWSQQDRGYKVCCQTGQVTIEKASEAGSSWHCLTQGGRGPTASGS